MKAGSGPEFEGDQSLERSAKKPNSLPVWGNEKSMNLNPLILTNIQSSQYFKVNLYQLKTYHEVIDEIYYQVSHLEPWEKGSRKTSGQTGMCGGVRGVGAGGIVSTAFCILYKLFTLKLTRKQVQGLINHSDSPYIRGLGFMYIRYTQPPADLWDWFEPYLDDDEEIDVRAGGGQTSTIGTIVRHMMTKLEWHSTLFPRIPVPIQKDVEKKMTGRAPVVIRETAEPNREVVACDREHNGNFAKEKDKHDNNRDTSYRDNNRDTSYRDNNRDTTYRDNNRDTTYRDNNRDTTYRDNNRDTSYRDNNRDTSYRDNNRDVNKDRERDRDYARNRQRSPEKDRDRDRHSHRDRRDKHHHHHRHHQSRSHRSERSGSDFAEEIQREKERIKKHGRSRSRDRSRDRERKYRY